MSEIKTTDLSRVAKYVEGLELSYADVVNVKLYRTLGNSLSIPFKVKSLYLSYDSVNLIYPRKIKAYVHTKSYTQMFNSNFICREGRKRKRPEKSMR